MDHDKIVNLQATSFQFIIHLKNIGESSIVQTQASLEIKQQEPLQYAYQYYSTVTAWLRVHHDTVSALDNNSCTALLVLDVSVAFDGIDHSILLRRLNYSFGLFGAALKQIEFYITQRRQEVVISGSASKDLELRFGVLKAQ